MKAIIESDVLPASTPLSTELYPIETSKGICQKQSIHFMFAKTK
jgi:hypothetical protein